MEKLEIRKERIDPPEAGGRKPEEDRGKKRKNGKAKRKEYDRELKALHVKLVRLQQWVQHAGLKVCIVFEGRDGAGKGGTIKAITERVSPRVFRVVALAAPTEREKSQMYLQRYIPHLPAAGEVVIFDRSWYNRAGVERVMGFCTEDQAKTFLKAAPLVEKAIVDSGVILLKYWLEVSEAEQTRRLRSRAEDGRKLWKLSPMDLKSYSRWYDYSRARDEMFSATDTAWAPWYVAHSDDKRNARLNIISHILAKIPQGKVPHEKIELPKRQPAHKYREPDYPYKLYPRSSEELALLPRAIAAAAVLSALVAMPAPLLPPQRLALAVQSLLGINWKMAYFVAAMAVYVVFYGALGLLATFVLNRPQSLRAKVLQVALAPCVVVGIAFAIRSIKLGSVPMAANLVVPVTACLAGVGVGLAVRYRAWRTTLATATALVGAALWAWLAYPSSDLAQATERHLRRLVAAAPAMPGGDARFGALVRIAFAALPDDAVQPSAIEDNRAAILALGIALGDERLARLVGLASNGDLLRDAAALRAGTTLRLRADWVRHYSLSAALAVLQHPFASDAAGLMKEQLDALTQGSGFSFADLAADRAGVRFAAAATHSEAAAQAMQARLQRGFTVSDFFPPAADFPEDLTVEQFRRDYGRVGSARYRALVAEIEARLDACPGLSGSL